VAPYKVLVVDDSKLARMVVTRAIRAANLNLIAIEAADAKQALSAMSAEQPDIALVDFHMPERDGLELASDIRLAHPDMPIAIISANIQTHIAAGAVALKASFIPKPIENDALTAFLSEAIARLQDGE
jgi:CheY-like chemotaxis protein